MEKRKKRRLVGQEGRQYQGIWERKDTMRSVVISFLLALALFGCAVGPNYRRPSDSPGVEATDIIATIDWIDYEKRMGTLKLPDGSKQTFNALPEATGVEQLKVGEQVILRGTGKR
jgi:hypothetical protein